MKTEALKLFHLIHPVHLLPVRNMKGKVPADMCAHQVLGSHKQFTVFFSLHFSQTQDTPAVYPQISKMEKPLRDQTMQCICPDMKCPSTQTQPRPSTKGSGSIGFTGHLVHG